MILCCEDCGFQKEIADKDYKREICPKCSLAFLQQDNGRIKSIAVKEAEKIVEARKEMPADIKEIAARSGKDAVVELVKQGKGFKQIVELMKGQLAITTVRCYYSYARQQKPNTGKDITTTKAISAESVAELPKELPDWTQLGRPRTGQWVNCAGCGNKTYIKQYRLKNKPADYPWYCGKCQRPERIEAPKRSMIESVPFIIYQEDLSFLLDAEFDEVWQAMGKIIKVMAKVRRRSCQV